MKETYERIVAYFDQNVARCKEQEHACAAEGRGDESVFEKICGNVYDIFRTVFLVAVKTHGDNRDAVSAFFREKLAQIPAGWQNERDKAAQHGDVTKQHIEELKWQTALLIRKNFERMWEECV